MADIHTPLWAVSIQGPDDLVPVADYLTAVRFANAFNEWWQRQKTEKPLHEYDPRMWAIPIEWAYADSEHEVNETGEYAGFFEAIADRSPSQDAETIKALREALSDFVALAGEPDPDTKSVREKMLIATYAKARAALAGSAS